MPWFTPASVPTSLRCRRLLIPDDDNILAAVNGALLELVFDFNWHKVEGVSPQEIAQAMLEMVDDFQDCEPAGGSSLNHFRATRTTDFALQAGVEEVVNWDDIGANTGSAWSIGDDLEFISPAYINLSQRDIYLHVDLTLQITSNAGIQHASLVHSAGGRVAYAYSGSTTGQVNLSIAQQILLQPTESVYATAFCSAANGRIETDPQKPIFSAFEI
jgi:hypothetical protein